MQSLSKSKQKRKNNQKQTNKKTAPKILLLLISVKFSNYVKKTKQNNLLYIYVYIRDSLAALKDNLCKGN